MIAAFRTSQSPQRALHSETGPMTPALCDIHLDDFGRYFEVWPYQGAYYWSLWDADNHYGPLHGPYPSARAAYADGLSGGHNPEGEE